MKHEGEEHISWARLLAPSPFFSFFLFGFLHDTLSCFLVFLMLLRRHLASRLSRLSIRW
jgi:hypothetical protein